MAETDDAVAGQFGAGALRSIAAAPERQSRIAAARDMTGLKRQTAVDDPAGGPAAGGSRGGRAAKLEITTSRQFESFLADAGVALAISTYQAGMVLFIGSDPSTGKLWIFNRHIERPMGLACDRARLAVSSLTQIITFIDGHHGTTSEGSDPIYVPQIAHFTGDLDVHEIAFAADGQPVFVNTLFSCLASVSATHSFRPIWKPPFISRLAAEDRCHLNGLAMDEGAPAYVTAVSSSDVADGWREHQRDGGLVMSVPAGEIVASGLSMPHSPRLHAGRLWVLNAGSGEIGVVDPAAGRFTPVAFGPGYLRGMAFAGRYALVGSSKPRDTRSFGDLPIEDRLTREGISPRCGVFVVDTETGDLVHWLRIEGIVEEIFDIAVIPSARKPTMIGFRSDEIRRVISIDGAAS